MSADSERTEDGLSRRQVLARGAVAAGVIWAAPVIRTATAYATSAAGTERPCTQFFLVACDALGVRPVRFAPDQHGYDEISSDATAVSTTSSTSSTTSTSTSTTTTTTTAPPAATPAPTDPSTTSTTTSTTTTTPPSVDPSTTTSTSTTTTTLPIQVPSQNDFGLFPDPAPTVAPGADPAAVLPPDPHVVAFSAAYAAAQAGTPDVLPSGIKTWLESNPDVPVRYPTEVPMLTQTSDDAWAITLPEVGGPDPLTHQCRIVSGWATAKSKVAESYLDPAPETLDEFGRRGIFPNPRADELASDPTALIDNIIFIFCCPQ